ncbi:MAG: TetR/AcrR family transcriptional regulator [Bdellovibrionales bacterium]|nr:TetR/AcrR family transcriptional regulator [Bdellovibrionales bacterium]
MAKPTSHIPESDVFRVLDLRPSKGDRKKLEIIHAAVDIVGTGKLPTTEAIAKKLKISTSHVVYYFKDKDELLLQMIRYVIYLVQRKVVAGLEDNSPWNSQLKHFLTATLDWAYEHPGHLIVHYYWFFRAGKSAKYRALHTEFRSFGLKRITAILMQQFPHEEAEVRARVIQEFLTGLLVEVGTTQGWKDLSDAKTHAIRSTEIILGKPL